MLSGCLKRTITGNPAVFGLVLLATACGKVLGVDDYRIAPPAAGSQCGSGFGYSAACDQCLATSCCAEVAACHDDPNCTGFEACFNGCTDDACRSACFDTTKHPKSPGTGQHGGLLDDKLPEKCEPEGACYGLGYVMGPECNACWASTSAGNACQPTVDCMNDPECRGYVTCVIACPTPTWMQDPTCRLQCLTQYPGARDKYFAVTSGLGGCDVQCGWGTHWGCYDQQGPLFSAPSARGTTTEVELRFFEHARDLTFCAVSAGHEACSAPAADAGTVLAVPVPQGNNPGYFHWTVTADGGAFEFLMYPGVPFLGPKLELNAWPSSSFFGPTAAADVGTVFVNIGDCLGSGDFSGTSETRICLSSDGTTCLDAPAPTYLGNGPSSTVPAGTFATFRGVSPGSYTAIAKSASGVLLATNAIKVVAGANTIVDMNLPVFEY